MLLYMVAYSMKGDEKLIRKFLSTQNITVEDCARLLTAYGYELHKSRGSHRTYHKKGTTPITIITPKGKRYMNAPYVRRIIQTLGLEE